MFVKFWGVRGSMPTATLRNMKYGGNTACIEVRTEGNQLLILDAGSGIRELGRKIQRELAPDGNSIVLFLTHYHWDHIQGLPFFEPMYVPTNRIYLHGLPNRYGGIEGALGEQMANPFFPVNMSVMSATRNFYTITEERLQIGDARITTRYLNHPQGCLGYRIENGGTVAYVSDNEHGNRAFDRNILELIDAADFLIYDAQYTPQEYKSKVGWGHSTWKHGVELAKEANVKELILFHHDPEHSDVFIDNMVREARRQFSNVHAAREGMQLDVPRVTSSQHHEDWFLRCNIQHRPQL